MQASSETAVQHPSVTSPVTSGRLKYANPRDLPSFPSHGLRQDGAAAGAAASLGWANQKSLQPWKPDKSSSASAAALLATDGKAHPPSWEPDSSAAGAKAALLATESSKNSASPRPRDTWGSDAANQAFRSSQSVRKPPIAAAAAASHARNDSGSSLLAAVSAARPRSKSSPIVKESYVAEGKTAANASALSAATLAHAPSMRAKPASENAGAVPYTTMNRTMFTAAPPVAPEVDEQRRADVLHASAVAMAKRMYDHQQRMADQTKKHAHKDSTHPASLDDSQPRPYVNLQEAAYKLAQERLAKLHEEHQKTRDYQEYYGNNAAPHRKLTMKQKLRRRASSDSDLADKERSARIRQQMSIFSDNVSKVDEQKRAKDRQALLVVAQRNVKAKLDGMDKKVYAETGKAAPSLLTEWELKAHAAAQAKHESRTEHKGKVDIGGGKFMDPRDVDAIATKRVQPVLDEINEKAAAERERQEIQRLETEAKKADAEKKKERDREIREINRKIREQDKQGEKEKRQQEKQEQRARKEEAKAVKAEEKRHQKEETQVGKETAGLATARLQSDGTERVSSGDSDEHNAGEVKVRRRRTIMSIATKAERRSGEEPRSPSEAGSPTAKMRNWFKARFSRPRGKSKSDPAEGGVGGRLKGFVGGAALRGVDDNRSASSLENRSASMREVALAGKNNSTPRLQTSGGDDGTTDSDEVSPISDDSDGAGFGGGRRDVGLTITPPGPIRDPLSGKSSSPSRDSRFREVM